MLDFLMISTRTQGKKDASRIEVYPRFLIKRSKDLMIRGGDFYAVWLESEGRWSTDEQDALQLIDQELDAYKKEHEDIFEYPVSVLHLWDADSGMIDRWHKYVQQQLRDNFHPLDETLIFSNTPTTKEDYSSKRLSYPLEAGDISAYDELIGTLYTPDERRKIEWAIGSIVSGDSKKIQKFIVLYGSAGTGKSTLLNIIQQLFDGYYSVFDARALGSSSNSFALEAFKANPLVAIQHDGDLSRIEDNTRLNSLVSHELMTVNEKFKSTYANRFNAFLFMGTNKPVKITDSKSGLTRRLIDVRPSGMTIPHKRYNQLVAKIPFELGAIATHCLEVYEDNKDIYDNYVARDMLEATNDFYNFVSDSYFTFKEQDGVSLKQAWEMYKTWCEDSNVVYPHPKRVFREELKDYFNEVIDRMTLDDGTRIRSYYKGFKADKFDSFSMNDSDKPKPEIPLIEFSETESIFDKEYADCPAQYAKDDGTPLKKWDSVKTKLGELDTSKLHYVRVPENHIVIDFDLKGEDGEKNFEKNLKAASVWPDTYAELSKSGSGIHLHYIYEGDVSKLSRVYGDNIEIKVFNGKSSLRRKLTKCNNHPIAHLNSGLPLKGDTKMVSDYTIKSEQDLRKRIVKNLKKEYHANTKPSIDFIKHLLDEAYASGMTYDVSDMKSNILSFAASSTNQSENCVREVARMKFKSEEPSAMIPSPKEAPLVFFDVEVYSNLFVVCWKYAGDEHQVVKMINPTSTEIEGLLKNRLVGFNNRDYDNHILYARLMGYSNEKLYDLSQKIISKKDRSAKFREAYNLSYTDVYDFSSKKQSLKKWEIELGISHIEMGIPWDQPAPEEMWDKIAGYCANDVLATEAVFNARKADFVAREILADIAGMSVNDTTNSLTTRIIFGTNRKPDLVYTDLATGKATDSRYERTDIINAFPGYEFKDGKNVFRGVDLGKGGYVYSEPGMYRNVALLDVASLHPHSIVAMNCFGEYTRHFKDLMDARIFIKHGDYESAKKLFGGELAKYLDDPEMASTLAQALKIAINSVYGLTSANFNNPFRDIRNKNNIVALRGALFMKTLQDEVSARGFTVAHIKTDSIKIPNATPEIIQFCMDFAKKYGYEFEHEATYEKMCLVNDAVYIAKYSSDEAINGKHAGQWTATGTQFQVPYVFKTLFSHEPIEFSDLCETKSVTSALYLDMNEGFTIQKEVEDEIDKRAKMSKKPDYLGYCNPAFRNTTDDELRKLADTGHKYVFVGRVGQFCPIKPGCGGGVLVRDNHGKFAAATASKGYRWLESEIVKDLHKEDCIDRSYYDNLVNEAVHDISEYGDFEWFSA